MSLDLIKVVKVHCGSWMGLTWVSYQRRTVGAKGPRGSCQLRRMRFLLNSYPSLPLLLLPKMSSPGKRRRQRDRLCTWSLFQSDSSQLTVPPESLGQQGDRHGGVRTSFNEQPRATSGSGQAHCLGCPSKPTHAALTPVHTHPRQASQLQILPQIPPCSQRHCRNS